jgi:diadenosine tetraphosphate (Ap4A) HIT family hydrolase
VNKVSQNCELCENPGGVVLWQGAVCRVIRVDDANYPGFCRVIWTDHEREMSDLDGEQQRWLMAAVFAVEDVIRQLFQPDKINLASFGNMVPHVHWHIIPRWVDDPHFPQPIWGAVQRQYAGQRRVVSDADLAEAVSAALGKIE